MIKFFRKIRKNLLTDGKTGKYFKYAIGEIFLVMVGILLALQVNTWNENRKESNTELDILTGIKNNLNDDINALKERVSYDSVVVARTEQLLDIMQNDTTEYDTTMDKLFGVPDTYVIFHPKVLSYTTLQQKGLSIISNDSLLSKIINVYDVSYVNQEDFDDILKSILMNSLNINYKYLSTGTNIFRKRPNDFKTLKSNNEYKNYLSYTAAIRRLFMNNTKDILAFSIEVRDEIEVEIKRLQK